MLRALPLLHLDGYDQSGQAIQDDDDMINDLAGKSPSSHTSYVYVHLHLVTLFMSMYAVNLDLVTLVISMYLVIGPFSHA